MKLVKLIQYVLRRRELVMRLCLAALALLVLFDAVPGWVNKEHAHTAPERWPAFWAVFGLAGCIVLILLSKAFGHAGILQREDYYDE
jgi:hypothetical protein